MKAPRRRDPGRRHWIFPAVLALGLLTTACAPIGPEARRLARAEHARESAPPATPPAAAPPRHHDLISWSLRDLAAVDASAVELQRDQDTVAILPGRALKAMLAAAERVTRVAQRGPSAPAPNFRIIEGHPANAYAVLSGEQALIAFNLGMIDLLFDDEAMWAAVIGHELAHLDHRHQQQRTERNDLGAKAGGVLAVILGFAGVPMASLLTDTAANLVYLGYSREDELEADAAAVSYLRLAGYDPAAALRFHERLAARSGNLAGSLLSTHPGGKERIEAIHRLLEPPPTR